ncbi:MAG TPA: Gfo/Idh/MocA family oxidoreductase [Armatimonadota bacterium]|nr:Gfo/Idh/MocA family oxidoreductase [Armatimonadota bacterium]
MRLCFVGYGSIAQAHARAFRQIPEVELCWLVGRDPQSTRQFAGEWGFPHWTLDLDEALAGDVDGVVITSPSDLHAAQAEAALQAGKHVLVEIPLATNLADAERVADLARETGLRVQVAHTQRYSPALLELRRRIADGELRPHHLHFRWFFLRRENVNWAGRRRSWTDNLLWHHGCHVTDAALWLLGPEPVSPVRAQFGPPHPELRIPLDLDLQLTVGETLVSIAMSYNSAWPRHEYFVVGEEGCLEFRDGQLRNEGGAIPLGGSDGESILNQDREWIEAIREDREPAVSPDAVLPAMRVLQAAQDQM